MPLLQKIGIGIFIIALAIFTLSLGLEKYELNEASVAHLKPYHKEAALEIAKEQNILGNLSALFYVF